LPGLAIVFSPLIDNSVIVIENVFPHLELGERPEVAAEKGGQKVLRARATVEAPLQKEDSWKRDDEDLREDRESS
jgi:Cu/Ag efflux pump CusA